MKDDENLPIFFYPLIIIGGARSYGENKKKKVGNNLWL